MIENFLMTFRQQLKKDRLILKKKTFKKPQKWVCESLEYMHKLHKILLFVTSQTLFLVYLPRECPSS